MKKSQIFKVKEAIEGGKLNSSAQRYMSEISSIKDIHENKIFGIKGREWDQRCTHRKFPIVYLKNTNPEIDEHNIKKIIFNVSPYIEILNKKRNLEIEKVNDRYDAIINGCSMDRIKPEETYDL